MSARYVFHQPTAFCMLEIDEGDPVPSMDEIAEAGRLKAALAAGDPRVQLVPAVDLPGCFEASWFTQARVA